MRADLMGWASMVVRVFSTFGMLVSLIFLTAYSSTSDARVVDDQGTWKSTLQPRDLDGDLGNGYEAYFDIELNVTWLTDTNLEWTSRSKYLYPHDDPLTFGETYIEAYGGSYPPDFTLGVWRLPYVEVIKYKPDPKVDATLFPYIVGFSEVNHLFRKTLGNTVTCEVASGCDNNDVEGLNTGPFLLHSYRFLTGIELFPTESHAGVQRQYVLGTPWGTLVTYSYGSGRGSWWPVFNGDIKNYPAMNPYLPGVPEPDSFVMALLAVLVTLFKVQTVRGFFGNRPT
jgi:hypothetical protein